MLKIFAAILSYSMIVCKDHPIRYLRSQDLF